MQATPQLTGSTTDWLLGLLPGHAVFAVDAEGRMASWNEGVHRLFGWERIEWLQLSLPAIFPLDATPGEGLLEQLRSTAGPEGAEQRRTLIRRDGSPVEVDCRLVTAPEQMPGPCHAVVCREVGDEPRAEEPSRRKRPAIPS